MSTAEGNTWPDGRNGRTRLCALAFGIGCMLAAPVQAQVPTLRDQVKDNTDRILTLMAFSVIPDLSASFLSFGGGEAGDANLLMTQASGGKTLAGPYPIYLEGSLGYMRYDPDFWISQSHESSSGQEVSGYWSTVSLTGGVGWDFKLTDNLVLRPIFNFSLGRVDSDFDLLGTGLRASPGSGGSPNDFLDNGQLNAYGLGGSLMLDYTLVKPEHEIDVELRYTNIRLQTFNTSRDVSGSAIAAAASLYGRYRAPTGIVMMDRPLRYVLELSSTTYMGDQRGALGFNYLSSLGAGIEFDTGAVSSWVSRARIIGRYAFGENVRGFSVGLAFSF